MEWNDEESINPSINHQMEMEMEIRMGSIRILK